MSADSIPATFTSRAGRFVYEICKRRKRAFRVKKMHFDNDEAAVAWIIRNQFARRNLTAMQRAELALKLKEAVAARLLRLWRMQGEWSPDRLRHICGVR